MLPCAENVFGGIPGLTAPEAVVLRAWPLYRTPYAPPKTTARITVPVEVNHGRWIVKCPYCAGAQLASREDPRFFCVDCLHEPEPRAQGKWLGLEWPADVEQIEAALDGRPEANRNWIPGEAVADLLRENALHGLVSA